MSAETKKAAQTAGDYLKRAGENIYSANEYAKKSGDKQLIEKVTKIQQDVKTTHEEVTKRLTEK